MYIEITTGIAILGALYVASNRALAANILWSFSNSCGHRVEMYLRQGAPLSQEMCPKCFSQGTMEVERQVKP